MTPDAAQPASESVHAQVSWSAWSTLGAREAVASTSNDNVRDAVRSRRWKYPIGSTLFAGGSGRRFTGCRVRQSPVFARYHRRAKGCDSVVPVQRTGPPARQPVHRQQACTCGRRRDSRRGRLSRGRHALGEDVVMRAARTAATGWLWHHTGANRVTWRTGARLRYAWPACLACWGSNAGHESLDHTWPIAVISRARGALAGCVHDYGQRPLCR